MKRNGFRGGITHMHPAVKVQFGLRMCILVLALVLANWAVVAAAVLAPVFVPMSSTLGIVPKFDKTGLAGDELELINKLEKRFQEMEVPSKENIIKEVRAAFADFVDETGKSKLDVPKLIEMLGDTDKGIRSILKKQGEEILALKESGKGEKKPKNLRTLLNENMAKIETIFKTGEGEIRLNVRAAAPMTLDNTIDGHADLPEDLIESFSIGQFVPKRQPREYVFDLASRRTVAQITQYKTWLEEGDEEGAFAIVTEGGLKPLVSQKLVRNHSEYAKVAAKHIVTEEFQKFRRDVYSIIQRLISQKILRDYAAILTTRLLADAAPYVASALDGQYAEPTDYHAIAAVAAQIEALDFMPDTLVLNPQDKWRIGMLQGNDGHFYLTIPVINPAGGTTMMGFNVRTSNRVAVGNFLLGEAGLWEIEDEALTVRIGQGVTITKDGANVTSVEHDFDHNRLRVIVETFFHSYIASNNEGSFVYANFDTVKAAVEAEVGS